MLLPNTVQYTEVAHTHWLLSRILWCNPVRHVLLNHLQVLLQLMLSVRWLHSETGDFSIPVVLNELMWGLGYSKSQTFFRIVFPQVCKHILPAVTNEIITLVKDTSLAFVLAVTEMFTMAKQIAAAQTSMVPYIAAGIFYYVFNLLVAMIMEKIEEKLNY